MISQRLVVLGCGLLLAAAAGCSTSTAGTPTASGGAGQATSAVRLAPPVPQPLDASSYLSRVCDLVTRQQLAAVGISKPGTADKEVIGPSCNWEADNLGTGTAYIAAINVESGGLEGIYQRRGNFSLFEPTTIVGYPAVHAADFDNTKTGQCHVAVGINDSTLIEVFSNAQAHDPDYTNTCPPADAFAATIIASLKGGR